MGNQDSINKDRVDILPNDVKVIWKFYKPKSQESESKSSKESLDSNDLGFTKRTSRQSSKGIKRQYNSNGSTSSKSSSNSRYGFAKSSYSRSSKDLISSQDYSSNSSNGRENSSYVSSSNSTASGQSSWASKTNAKSSKVISSAAQKSGYGSKTNYSSSSSGYRSNKDERTYDNKYENSYAQAPDYAKATTSEHARNLSYEQASRQKPNYAQGETRLAHSMLNNTVIQSPAANPYYEDSMRVPLPNAEQLSRANYDPNSSYSQYPFDVANKVESNAIVKTPAYQANYQSNSKNYTYSNYGTNTQNYVAQAQAQATLAPYAQGQDKSNLHSQDAAKFHGVEQSNSYTANAKHHEQSASSYTQGQYPAKGNTVSKPYNYSQAPVPSSNQNQAYVKSNAYSQAAVQGYAHGQGKSQSHSAERPYSQSQGERQSYGHSQSASQSYGQGQTIGHDYTQNQDVGQVYAQEQATGQAYGQGQRQDYAQSQGAGHSYGQSQAAVQGYGQSQGHVQGQGPQQGGAQGKGQAEEIGASATNKKVLDELSGLVERITFHSEESGFCVLRIKVKGEHDLITVVGHTSSVTPGEYITAHGFWTYNKEYGRQFRSERMDVYPPNTLDGIERYLGSGMVKGVGPKTAKTLVEAYGKDVFEIIEQDPSAMLNLHGIGKRRANKIASGWADQKVIRAIMVFLHSHGVSTSKSVRIFNKYGQKAIEVVKENPYILAKDIRGIGFKSADTIAANIGIAEHSPLRAQAGVAYALSDSSANNGHCCLPRAELIKLTQELLNIPEDIINEAINHELESAELKLSNIPYEDSIFLTPLYICEQRIALNIKMLLNSSPPWPAIKEDIALDWVEKKLAIQLADSQKQAVKTALHSKVMVITGGPGVGKTTIVKAILTILGAKNINIMLCAPTGRAAKRLSESSGYEAMTIHRMLKVDPATMQFTYNESNPLDCDLLVVDECSMVDIPLANNLLKAVPRHASVIFVGDIDQLPSVGPGAFLGDLINSNCIEVIRLTEVFRQAASSWIIRVAHQINKGYFPTFPKKDDKGDCYFVVEDDREHLPQTIVSLVKDRLTKAYGYDPIKDIQVLCPMNRGETGARALNMLLQDSLNPPNENSIHKFGISFSIGDKVMQIENNYDRDVYNGDVGFVKAIDKQEQELLVSFDDREVVYPFDELDELVLSYACTIHKSQGSEYPVVVIPVSMQHYVMLKRNLIYTGVTRGKKLVVLVGEKKALNMAVKDWRTQKRNSGLKDTISKALLKETFELEFDAPLFKK